MPVYVVPQLVFVHMDEIAARLEALEVSLRRQTDQLLAVLRNPAATAAAESHHIGLTAFMHGWYEEAETAFSKAIDRYPLRSSTLLFRGLCRLRLGSVADADDDLSRSVRYGEAAEPEAAVAAVLFRAMLCDCSSPPRPDAAVQLLTDAVARWACVELDQELQRRGVHRQIDDTVMQRGQARRVLVEAGLPLPSDELDTADYLVEAHRIALETAKREVLTEGTHPYWHAVRSLKRVDLGTYAPRLTPLVVPPLVR